MVLKREHWWTNYKFSLFRLRWRLWPSQQRHQQPTTTNFLHTHHGRRRWEKESERERPNQIYIRIFCNLEKCSANWNNIEFFVVVVCCLLARLSSILLHLLTDWRLTDVSNKLRNFPFYDIKSTAIVHSKFIAQQLWPMSSSFPHPKRNGWETSSVNPQSKRNRLTYGRIVISSWN